MKKLLLFPAVVILGLTVCGKDNPVLKMGTVSDNTGHKVYRETATFSMADTIAFSLSQDEPFNTSMINVRIYRGNDIFDMVRVHNENIPVTIERKSIEKSIPPWELAGKFGTGNYMLMFIIGETVIARRNFSIELPKMQVIPAEKSEIDQNNTPPGDQKISDEVKAVEGK